MKILCFSDPHQLVKDTFPSFKLAPSKSRQILPGLAYAVTTSVGAVSHLKLWHSYICVIINLLWGIIFFFHSTTTSSSVKPKTWLCCKAKKMKTKQIKTTTTPKPSRIYASCEESRGKKDVVVTQSIYMWLYMWLEMTTLFSLAWPIFGS